MKAPGTPFSLKLSRKKAAFKARLESLGLLVLCRELAAKKHFARSMLVDMLKRDYPELMEEFGFSTVQVGSMLKTCGVETDNKAYLRLPQEVKLQFRYPADYTQEQIRQEQQSRSRRGFDTMIAARRKQQHYHPKNHTEFWMSQGLDSATAEKKAQAERKRKSPFSTEFGPYTDMSLPDRKFLISQLAANRGLRGLEAMGTCTSALERKLAAALSAAGVEFETQHCIGTSRALRARFPGANTVYMFDIHITGQRLLVECNGTYWHADPRVYAGSDTLHHPGVTVKAETLWQADALKAQIANEFDYRVVVLWELDAVKPGFVESFIKEHIRSCSTL